MTGEKQEIGKEVDKNIKGMKGMQFLLPALRKDLRGSHSSTLWENLTEDLPTGLQIVPAPRVLN